VDAATGITTPSIKSNPAAARQTHSDLGILTMLNLLIEGATHQPAIECISPL
jgi:hypothetical protein